MGPVEGLGILGEAEEHDGNSAPTRRVLEHRRALHRPLPTFENCKYISQVGVLAFAKQIYNLSTSSTKLHMVGAYLSIPIPFIAPCGHFQSVSTFHSESSQHLICKIISGRRSRQISRRRSQQKQGGALCLRSHEHSARATSTGASPSPSSPPVDIFDIMYTSLEMYQHLICKGIYISRRRSQQQKAYRVFSLRSHQHSTHPPHMLHVSTLPPPLPMLSTSAAYRT